MACAKTLLLPQSRSSQYPFTDLDLHLIAYLRLRFHWSEKFQILRTLNHLPQIDQATIRVAQRQIRPEQVMQAKRTMSRAGNKNHHFHSYWQAFNYYNKSPYNGEIHKVLKPLHLKSFPKDFAAPRPEYLEAIYEGARRLDEGKIIADGAYIEKAENVRLKKITDDFEVWSTHYGMCHMSGGNYYIWVTSSRASLPA
ncbi:MAG: hypothetical protein Q9170_004602 [Blastenia crenularia]